MTCRENVIFISLKVIENQQKHLLSLEKVGKKVSSKFNHAFNVELQRLHHELKMSTQQGMILRN